MLSSLQCCKKIPKKLVIACKNNNDYNYGILHEHLLYLKVTSFITYIPLLDVGKPTAVNMREGAGMSSAVDTI